jgi:hypothetical protein
LPGVLTAMRNSTAEIPAVMMRVNTLQGRGGGGWSRATRVLGK